MTYISVDGDDIGQRITALYITNDPEGLSTFAELVRHKVESVAKLFRSVGQDVIFCAADGVVSFADADINGEELFRQVQAIGDEELTFSMGVGQTLREAYVALLLAKTSGKNQVRAYSAISNDV